MARIVRDDKSEHRTSERITLNVDAKFSVGNGNPSFCVIRDFCDGGLFFTFSGVDPNFKFIKEQGISRGQSVHLEFYHRKKLIQMDTLFVRLLDNAMAVRFPDKNPKELVVFQEVAKQYQHIRENAKSIHITNIEYQKALAKAENLVFEFIDPLLDNFLENLDGSLIKEATKAANDAEEAIIMDAATLIQRNHASIKHNYKRDLVNGIVTLTKGEKTETNPSERMSITTDQLSIVAKEEFEDWLIIKVMISKAEQTYRDLLLELQLRIDSLTGNKRGRVDNPIAPAAIANQFRGIVRSLNLEHKVEKTVYGEFERAVLRMLEPLYVEINNLLIEYGVLPDLVLSQYLSKGKKAEKKDASTEDKNATQAKTEANQSAQSKAASNDQKSGGNAASGAPTQQPTSATGQSGPANGPSSANGASIAAQSSGSLGDHTPAAKLATSSEANLKNAKDVLSATHELLKLRREQERSLNKAASVGGQVASASQVSPVNTGDGASAGVSPQQGNIESAAQAGASPQPSSASTESDSAEGIAKSIKTVIQDLQKDIDRYYSLVSELQNENASNTNQTGLLRNLLTSLTPASPGGQLFTVQEDEAVEVIDGLVSSILSNPTVVQEIKPYFNKLRLPLFQLLMQDSEFLTTEKHPARQVMNQMAELGNDEGPFNEQTKTVLTDGVRRILEEYETDVEVYSDLLDDLNKLTKQQESIYRRNISRVAEVYEGQEKIAMAKEQVAEEIDNRFKGSNVPVVVNDLLENGWRDLMRLSLLRQGEDSKPWKMALDVLDHLKHFLQDPHAKQLEGEEGSAEPVDLELDPAALMKVIKTGLQRVDTLGRCETILKELEQLLAFEGKIQPRRVKYKLLSEKSKLNREMNNQDQLGAWSPKQQLLKWVKRAQRVQVGDWVRFFERSKEEDAGKRVRVAWVARDKSRFVFVNQQGVKFCDLTLKAFALKLKDGKANLIGEEDVAVVDQGLEAMVQKIYEQLAHESTHDPLTGLYNRKEFERRVLHALRLAKKANRKHVISYVDLSQFQVVNSSCGFHAGDALLKKVAKILVKTAPKDSIVARLGGNEFGVLLLNHSEEKGYRIIDAQMQAIKSIRFQWEDSLYRIGANIGLLEISEDSFDVQHLLQNAEACCIAAKEAGGDRIITYKPDGHEMARRETVMAWVTKVNTALEEDRLKLRMQRIQPIGEFAKTGVLPHYEVLLSAVDEKGNSITPIEFVRAAERYNRMQVVDQWVIRTVLSWMEENPSAFEKIGGVAINLSGHSINDDRLMKFIFEEFTQKVIPRDKLCFEITETTAVTHLPDAADFITELKKVGCKFALDDFGTGMSSYTYLKYLPVDFVKIDGTFVKNIATDEMDFAMVKSMNEMAHCMGKKTVAEFVANEAILEKLMAIGVDYAQGYHVEKPLWMDQWGKLEEDD